jgi:hypothetical protein
MCLAMEKLDTKPARPAINDRRAGADRRHLDDALPPGKRDRRRGLEARKPEVIEIDMSPSEWAALTEAPAPKTTPKK